MCRVKGSVKIFFDECPARCDDRRDFRERHPEEFAQPTAGHRAKRFNGLLEYPLKRLGALLD